MDWNKTQIKQHKQAAQALNEIIKKIVEFIRRNPKTTDVAIRQFIKEQYKKYHLRSDKHKSIVAFGKNTSRVHYYAEVGVQNIEPLLKDGDLIMIDIWAKLAKIGAPFADITWMLYYGRKLPREYDDAFMIVAQARDRTIRYLQNNLPASRRLATSRGGKKKILPIGKAVDAVARNYLNKRGHGDKFLHGTGHSLGLTSPHGTRTRINRKGRQPLPLNVGYTIEPGIYFKDEFGIRSEINFYIGSPREIPLSGNFDKGEIISRGKNYKLIITTKIQNQIIYPVK